MFRPEFGFAIDPRNNEMDLQEAIPFGSQEHFENALPAVDGSMDGWLNSNLPWTAGVVASPYASQFETGPSFQTYRNGPLSSDCGETQPDDSGYGKSIETVSVRGDDSIPVVSNSNCPDVEQNFNRLHLAQESFSAATPVVYTQNGHLSAPEYPDPLVCRVCKSSHRNKSELKKHLARHERRYVCDHTKCKKSTVGFASHNDLVRHKRTVHAENLDGPLYVCPHGDCAKSTPPKKWPRADNFRSHLKRVHDVQPDLNLCSYRYPNISEDLQGVGTKLQDSLVLPTNPLFPNSQHGQPDRLSEFPEAMQFQTMSNIPQYDQEASLDGLSPYMSPGYVDRQRSSSLHLSPTIEQYPQAPMEIHVRPASPEFESELDQVMDNGLKTEPYASPPMNQPKLESDVSSITDDDSDIDLPVAAPSPVSDINSDMEKKECDISLEHLRKCFEATSDAEQLHFLSSLSKDQLMSALRMRAESCDPEPLPSGSKAKVKCSKCDKGFKRPCELRKHSKRHDKPYGCTFHSCDKVFGSKNDWKRHEVQQHSPIQTWHCVPDCDERFSSRDGFQSHLREVHTDSDQEMERLLEDNRQDMESAPSFWCGFCRDMVSFPSDRTDPRRTIRFDHIDDHFMGRQGHAKQTIAEWVPMEDSPPPRRLSRQRKKKFGVERNVYQSTRSRKRKLSSPPESRPAKQLHTTAT